MSSFCAPEQNCCWDQLASQKLQEIINALSLGQIVWGWSKGFLMLFNYPISPYNISPNFTYFTSWGSQRQQCLNSGYWCRSLSLGAKARPRATCFESAAALRAAKEMQKTLDAEADPRLQKLGEVDVQVSLSSSWHWWIMVNSCELWWMTHNLWWMLMTYDQVWFKKHMNYAESWWITMEVGWIKTWDVGRFQMFQAVVGRQGSGPRCSALLRTRPAGWVRQPMRLTEVLVIQTTWRARSPRCWFPR